MALLGNCDGTLQVRQRIATSLTGSISLGGLKSDRLLDVVNRGYTITALLLNPN
jgi:hypothetical protein